MKIIITEEQAKLLIEGEIKCPKCDHSWVKKSKDKHPIFVILVVGIQKRINIIRLN